MTFPSCCFPYITGTKHTICENTKKNSILPDQCLYTVIREKKKKRIALVMTFYSLIRINKTDILKNSHKFRSNYEWKGKWKRVNITGLRFVHLRLVFFFLSCQIPASDAAWLSCAINASTKLLTILTNQSGNLKFSICISKRHLLHFLWILDVKDILFLNCFLYYTTMKSNSCYEELLLFFALEK